MSSCINYFVTNRNAKNLLNIISLFNDDRGSLRESKKGKKIISPNNTNDNFEKIK